MSSCNPASDRKHLTVFIAAQVQNEASSTMERGKLAAAALCGKHRCTPRNQNKDTERGKNWNEIKEIVIFACSISLQQIQQKTFPHTTGLIALESSGKQRPALSSLALQWKREKITIKIFWVFRKAAVRLEEEKMETLDEWLSATVRSFIV